MTSKKKIHVKGIDVVLYDKNNEEYISLTDIARYKNPSEPKDVVKNWMRTRSTIEFLGLWEQLNNPLFKGVEFDSFLFNAGGNAFTLSPQRWIEATNAIGIVSKSGNLGGTFAHKDIAFEFASWVNPVFKLYLIKELQRLKADENTRLHLEWSLQRTISKINYKIHTDAIKESLIPAEVTPQQAAMVYASEADLLNVALFGITAKQWRETFPDKKGNIRDMASLEQLVVLSNLESINALLVSQEIPQSLRLLQLNKVAITQIKSLLENTAIKKLKK